MTRILAFAILLVPGLAFPGVAFAQVPQTGAAAPPGGAPDGVFTAAPVPSPGTSPALVGPAGAPGAIPDQVAPSTGQAAGPINSTPFSTTGSGLQPPDVASPHNANRTGSPAATPNVSP